MKEPICVPLLFLLGFFHVEAPTLAVQTKTVVFLVFVRHVWIDALNTCRKHPCSATPRIYNLPLLLGNPLGFDVYPRVSIHSLLPSIWNSSQGRSKQNGHRGHSCTELNPWNTTGARLSKEVHLITFRILYDQHQHHHHHQHHQHHQHHHHHQRHQHP